MAISEKKRKLITRTLGALVIAAVVIPAYLIKGGAYFHWVLRFGFLVALIEFTSIVCKSRFLPLRADEYAITALVSIELIACLFSCDQLPVELIGGCVFVCVITDVFAYLMGTIFGGRLFDKRPFPKISPNKSYEGLISGVSLGIIGALIWTTCAQDAGTPVPFWRLAIAAPLSVLGDLLESRFKRLYDIKDANDFLVDTPVIGWLEKPLGGRDGHGGYLDRLDSLALVLLVQLLIP